MTRGASVFGRLTFATAVHHMAMLRVWNWASSVQCLDQLFPDDVAAVHFPSPIDADMVAAIDAAIRTFPSVPLLHPSNIEIIVDAGYNAGVASIKRLLDFRN